MNKRIRKKHIKVSDNEKLTRGGYFTKTNSKLDKKWLLIGTNILVMIGMFLFMKTSYAYLYQTLQGNKTYSLKVKGFELKLDDSSTLENIKIEESIPVSDENGKQSTAYTFSIINEDPTETGYILYLDDVEIEDEINRMKDSNIKYQLIENGKERLGLVSELGTHPFRILVSGVISGNTTNNYSLRFWIKEEAEVSTNQVFNVKIRVLATSREAIEEGKLVFGETIVTSDSGVTSMTSDQLQSYVDKALENRLVQKESEILDKNHPVGSIYITEANQNPSELFGGVWEAYASGRTLVGIDAMDNDFSMIAKVGGVKYNNLSHTHTVNNHTHSLNNHTHGLSKGYAKVDINVANGQIVMHRQGTIATWGGVRLQTTTAISDSSESHNNAALGGTTDAASGNTGGSSPATTASLTTAVTNLQPYTTVYMWKRIR